MTLEEAKNIIIDEGEGKNANFYFVPGLMGESNFLHYLYDLREGDTIYRVLFKRPKKYLGQSYDAPLTTPVRKLINNMESIREIRVRTWPDELHISGLYTMGVDPATDETNNLV